MPRASKRSRKPRSRLWIAAAGLLLLAAVAGLYLHHVLFSARSGAFAEPVLVEIPKGTSTAQAGRLLAEARVLASAWHLPALRILQPWRKIQAGEYEFKKAATPAEVFLRLARGDVFYHEVTIPEGSHIWDVARILEREQLLRGDDFLAVARSPRLISDLAPEAPSLEGYLFPSTYRFRRRTSAEEIARAMTGQFRKEWRALGVNADVHRIVTLASLVEKETSIPEERGKVAGVYFNRLGRGIKLDCDPTVIYAALLLNRWDGIIHRSDLDRDHPFNTYQRSGLPPGPIASPGRAALQAALEPEKTDALFFVARPDGSGGHTFSATMAAHDAAVAAYRRGQPNHKEAAPRVDPGTKAGPRHAGRGR